MPEYKIIKTDKIRSKQVGVIFDRNKEEIFKFIENPSFLYFKPDRKICSQVIKIGNHAMYFSYGKYLCFLEQRGNKIHYGVVNHQNLLIYPIPLLKTRLFEQDELEFIFAEIICDSIEYYLKDFVATKPKKMI